MITRILKSLSSATCVLFIALTPISKAEVVGIFDFDITVLSAPSGANILGARWGVWNGAQFIQVTTNSANAGYLIIGDSELSVSLNQIDNTNYTPGSPLALAIYTNGSSDSQLVNWSATSGFGAVLTDPSWISPTFSNSAAFINYSFTSSTVARIGTFNFNGGVEQVTLTAIPEPSSFAAFAGLAMLGTATLRRRKRVA